jgi:hypothetical protein
MDLVTQIIVWLNVGGNAFGKYVLAPIAVLPGWLSATLVAVGSGILFLVIFKYTSNQAAIKKVRDDIKAHLLALKLFKENPWVTLRAQGRILRGAALLLVHAVVPMLVMALPVSLLLAQVGLWYQARPLKVGEEAVVSVKLNGNLDSSAPHVCFQPNEAIEMTLGPVQVTSKREIWWNIRPRADGYQRLVFHVGEQTTDKELAVGEGFMRVGIRRPGWNWHEAILHPMEKPFARDSSIESIEIEYEDRPGWASGTNSWMIFWFLGSMISGFCLRRFLKVNL